MSKLLTLKLSDEHRERLLYIRTRLGLSSDVEAVRYWCDHGAELLDLRDKGGATAPTPASPGPYPPNKQERIAVAREALAEVEATPKTGRDRLTPALRAHLEAGTMPPGFYPSHDFTPKHPLRDERGWGLADKRDWIDGKPHYVDPAKRMTAQKAP